MTLMVLISKLWLQISPILFIICCVQSSYLSKFLKKADEFTNTLKNWELTPIGKTSAEFLQAFITRSIKKELEELLRDWNVKNFSKTLYSVVLHTFFYQVPVFVVVLMLFIITFLMIALPYCISLYRTEKSLRVNDPVAKEALINLGKNGHVWFECFIATVIIAVFGILITMYASLRTYYLLKAPFLYFLFTVDATYLVKTNLQHNYEYKLDDISRRPFDRVVLLQNINDDIVNSFNLAERAVANPLLDVASSIHWQISHAKFILKHQRAMLINVTRNTSSVAENSLKLFTSYVKAIKNETTRDTSKLDSLLKIPQFNITINTTFETYNTPINALTDATKLNISASIQNVNLELAQLAKKVRFDPSELVDKLTYFIFEAQQKVRTAIFHYFTVADKSINTEGVKSFRNVLHDMEADFTNQSFPLFVFISSLYGLSLVCVLILAVAYSCAVGGTKCFSKNQKEHIQKSKTSNRSGHVLLGFCYAISIFLWICWLSNIYFFLMTALQLQMCNSVKDLSFFSATLDNVSYRKSTHFYSIFSSEELNSTINQNIIKCQKDNDYFATISHDFVNFLRIAKTNTSSNFENVTLPFYEGLKNLSALNVSSSEYNITKLKNILEEVDTVSVPNKTNEYLQHVKKFGVLEILEEIANSPNSSSSTLNYTSLATKSYESLTSSVNSLMHKNNLFKLSLKNLNNTLQSTIVQMEYLNWTAGAFHDFIVKESSKAYSEIFNQTIHTKIDEVIFELANEISKFRSSISFCRPLLNMHDKGKILLCNILLYPIAVCWFGSTLICIGLFVSVVISVHSSQLFLFPSDEYAESGAASEDGRESQDTSNASPTVSSISKRSRYSNDCSISSEGDSFEGKDESSENSKFASDIQDDSPNYIKSATDSQDDSPNYIKSATDSQDDSPNYIKSATDSQDDSSNNINCASDNKYQSSENNDKPSDKKYSSEHLDKSSDIMHKSSG
ncbi:hypothetical protein JTE90_002387 [Oedothorax gibbosus]|uniref:Uncharacterized protein n=1 Tax=Oedothorax gibbosus TaxID=931172 RepID=A0AAV6VDP3_9ARAC|nr:hypothetical protein JTE90_002387 [Oedothorax gibbosus]